MFISYHICEGCGRKITNTQDVFCLEIQGKFEDKRGVVFELCAECADEAKGYYNMRKEAVVEKTRAAF